MFRKYSSLVVLCVLALVCTACDACDEKNNPNPMAPGSVVTTPIGPTPTTQVSRVVIQLDRAIDRAVNAISINIRGATSSDELIRGLPLDPADPFKNGDQWSGALIHVLSYNAVINGKVGWSGNTSIPFTPPSTDHFQFNSVPTGGTLDIALQLIPGGQPVGGPFHVINVDPSATNVTISSPKGSLYTFDRTSDGKVHIKGPLPY